MAQYELNLRDYFRIIRRRKWLIFVIFLFFTIASLIYSYRQIPIYEAVATIKIYARKPIAAISGTEITFWGAGSTLESEVELIKSDKVLAEAARRLGYITTRSSEEDLKKAIIRIRGTIATEQVETTDLVEIRARHKDPKEVARIAMAVAESYADENWRTKINEARTTRQFIEQQLADTEEKLKETEDRLKEIKEKGLAIETVAPLQDKLNELTLTLTNLRKKYTDKHPEIKKTKDQIKIIQQQLRELPADELTFVRLKRELKINEELYSMLKDRYEKARIAEASKIRDVEIVNPAMVPEKPISPNRYLNLLMGMVVGIILGFSAAFVSETLDTSIATIEDVESVIKLPVLGIVPSIEEEGERRKGIFSGLKRRLSIKSKRSDSEDRMVRLTSHYKPKSPAAEAFRNIRTNLKLDTAKKTLLVTSSGPREGKTTVMTNLGLVMAQAGAKTLLVSSDLRRPALAKTFGIKREPGLNELLTGSADLDKVLRNAADIILGDIPFDEIVSKPFGIDNIWILPSGVLPFNPAEVLESKELTGLIEVFKQRFDIIIFDSAPVLPVTDASLLAPKLDCVVIVYEIGRTSRDALLRAKIQLESVGAKISGVILNHTQPQTETIVTYPYYYQYKYKFYGKEEAEQKT